MKGLKLRGTQTDRWTYGVLALEIDAISRRCSQQLHALFPKTRAGSHRSSNKNRERFAGKSKKKMKHEECQERKKNKT